jgi:hypothetical protein
MLYGWDTMTPGDNGDDDEDLVTAQLAVAARYLYRDRPPMRWFLVGRLGVASPASGAAAVPLADLRPLVGVGIGFERRVRAFAFQAELGASLLAPRFSSSESFDDLVGPDHEQFRASSWVRLGSFTLGVGYYF